MLRSGTKAQDKAHNMHKHSRLSYQSKRQIESLPPANVKVVQVYSPKRRVCRFCLFLPQKYTNLFYLLCFKFNEKPKYELRIFGMACFDWEIGSRRTIFGFGDKLNAFVVLLSNTFTNTIITDIVKCMAFKCI